MDKVVIVKMDKQGRILIPADIRKRIGSELFIVEIVGDEIKLKPIRPIRLTSLFDRIIVDVDDFTNTHELRRAIQRSSINNEVS